MASIYIKIFVCGILASLSFLVNAQEFPKETSFQEGQCAKQGWQPLVLDVGGLQRRILWKGPSVAWSKGAIIVMHGGGGHHFQFCIANARFLEPQVRFTELALAKGFAVFLLESSNRVTDNEERICGKVWDDEVRDRPNLDLPFIGEVINSVIPNLRPTESREEIFVTGISSGGYMTVRAATHFGNLVTAFAPVSSGDPYGWHRICEKGMNQRQTVHGAGFDNASGKMINEHDSCRAASHPNEKVWDGTDVAVRPAFRAFHHRYDGVNDLSCVDKVITLLRKHHYPEVPEFLLEGGGNRNIINHFWQDAYNEPLLEFFIGQLRTQAKPGNILLHPRPAASKN